MLPNLELQRPVPTWHRGGQGAVSAALARMARKVTVRHKNPVNMNYLSIRGVFVLRLL